MIAKQAELNDMKNFENKPINNVRDLNQQLENAGMNSNIHASVLDNHETK